VAFSLHIKDGLFFFCTAFTKRQVFTVIPEVKSLRNVLQMSWKLLQTVVDWEDADLGYQGRRTHCFNRRWPGQVMAVLSLASQKSLGGKKLERASFLATCPWRNNLCPITNVHLGTHRLDLDKESTIEPITD
jgi:hypothetical protein